MVVVQIIVFLLGLLIALSTLFSAIKQTVLPGRKKVRLSRAVFRTTFRLFRLVIVRIPSEQAREALSGFLCAHVCDALAACLDHPADDWLHHDVLGGE